MVTNINDSGSGSLRQAILDASSGDTINFNVTGTIILTSGNLLVDKDLTIIGPGADQLTISANLSSRVIKISSGSTVLISGLTIKDGTDDGNRCGGGIYNDQSTLTLDACIVSSSESRWGGGVCNDDGTLNVMNSEISGNRSPEGAGIYNKNDGTLNVINSEISNNISGYSGGGIQNFEGFVFINNSTIKDNRAEDGGGGLYTEWYDVTVTNSTFSGNSTNRNGGGVAIWGGDLYLNNATFSANVADADGNDSGNGGGIFERYSSISTRNTIIAGNQDLSSSGDLNPDCEAEINSEGYNLIQDTTGCTINGDTTGNITGLDPKLGPLADNGGKTMTHALLSGSPAVDAANPIGCKDKDDLDLSTDQRGEIRPAPFGGRCDMGAFEKKYPVLVKSTPADRVQVNQDLTQIQLEFNQALKSGAGSGSSENTENYLLVQDGVNGLFDTTSCAQGVSGDDIPVPVDDASYAGSDPFLVTLNINGGIPLPNDSYRLFVCGTTSVESADGSTLNNGVEDSTLDFSIVEVSVLPKTGFPRGQVTEIAEQPASQSYMNLGNLWLEIPKLDLQKTIVGVPAAEASWNVSWLGTAVGYLEGSAFPTWEGNTVMTAHVWNANNQPGPFINLRNLVYGDEIKLHAWGQVYTYEVRERKLISPYSTRSVMEHLERDWLTLFTCEDYRSYSENYAYRRVVQAVLVDLGPEH